MTKISKINQQFLINFKIANNIFYYTIFLCNTLVIQTCNMHACHFASINSCNASPFWHVLRESKSNSCDCRRSLKNNAEDALGCANLVESERSRLFLSSSGIRHCPLDEVRVVSRVEESPSVTIHLDYFQQLPRANQVMSAKT